jgi:integrase
MANDMSARPHEILNLKIKDILFKNTENGTQHAEVLITGGKTKPRTLPLIDSIPYIKDWIGNHPTGNNPESWLFVSLSKNSFGSRLSYDGLSRHYKYYYRKRYFPKLLNDDSFQNRGRD